MIYIHKDLVKEVQSVEIAKNYTDKFRVGMLGEKEGIIQKIEWMCGTYQSDGGCWWTPFISAFEVNHALQLLVSEDYKISGFIKTISNNLLYKQEPYLFWRSGYVHGTFSGKYPTLLFVTFIPRNPSETKNFFVTKNEDILSYEIING